VLGYRTARFPHRLGVRQESGDSVVSKSKLVRAQESRWNEKAGLPAGCDMLPLKDALEVQKGDQP